MITVHTVTVVATIDGQHRTVQLDVENDHRDPDVALRGPDGERCAIDRASVVLGRAKGADSAAVALALATGRQAVRVARLRDAAMGGG